MGGLLTAPCLLKGRRGFTLIETLVAVMVLAISLVVIMQLFSGGLKSNKLSSDYLYGIFHAREKMEEILLSGNLVPGSSSGEFDDGYSWVSTVDVAKAPDETDELENRMPFDVFNVKVEVFWENGKVKKHFEIKTATLAKKPENQGLATE